MKLKKGINGRDSCREDIRETFMERAAVNGKQLKGVSQKNYCMRLSWRE